MEPHQETNSENLFFPNSKFPSFLAQNKPPNELLASYSPDFQYVEALLGGGQSPDLQYVDSVIQESPLKGFGEPPGLHQGDLNKEYQSYFDPFKDNHTQFISTFPRAKDYSNMETILETFPHLEGVNSSNFNVDEISQDAHFYIMRSSNDDNIHKAIKYHIWTTTLSGKNLLSKAWKEFEDMSKEPEVYLFFSVVNSNQFLGVAKLISDIDHNESFKYWWEPLKWFGAFQIKWLFVKDIPHSSFEHLKQKIDQKPGNMGYNNKSPIYCSVTNLRDSTKIKADLGKQMLDIFVKQSEKPNIFESFSYIDRREDRIRTSRDNDSIFNKKFEEFCSVYKKYPDCFRLPSSQNPKRKSFKKPYVDTQNGNYQNNTSYNTSGKYKAGQQTSENEEQIALDQENTEYRDYRNYRGSNKSTRGRGFPRGGRGPRFYANKRGDYHNYHHYGGHDDSNHSGHTNGYDQGNYYQRDM